MHCIQYNAVMKTLTIRNVPRRLADALDRERRNNDVSLNQLVIDTLSRGLGVEAGGTRRNGLAALAGTWSADDLARFEDAIAPLETVDEDMWS